MSLISQKSCFKRDNGRKLIGDSECREPSGDVLLQMGSNQKLAEVGSKEGFYKTGEIITGLKVDENDSGVKLLRCIPALCDLRITRKIHCALLTSAVLLKRK